jgi:hypothetical protein
MQPLDQVPAILRSLVAVRKALADTGCWPGEPPHGAARA